MHRRPLSLAVRPALLGATAALVLLPAGTAGAQHDARHSAHAGALHPAHAATGEVAGVAVPAPLGESRVGVLVMAHGGDADWNASVDAALAPLRGEVPTALAFGMAARPTLAAGIDSLRAAGVERIAVVRMFLSGTSFRAQSDYLLGLSGEAPAHYMHHGPDGRMLHGEHAAHMEPPPPIDTDGLTVLTHDEGLKAWHGVGRIVEERALALSSTPSRERVLILAHGMGDEDENQAVLDDMARAAAELGDAGFAAVQPETLREDWAEAREEAEARIRGFMDEARAAGHTVLVVPFRLSGFGPYAEVLEEWDYRAGDGLLPHPTLTDWARERAGAIACRQGWRHPALSCPADVVTEEPTSGD